MESFGVGRTLKVILRTIRTWEQFGLQDLCPGSLQGLGPDDLWGLLPPPMVLWAHDPAAAWGSQVGVGVGQPHGVGRVSCLEALLGEQQDSEQMGAVGLCWGAAWLCDPTVNWGGVGGLRHSLAAI